MKRLKLEVGKTYRSREGEEVKIVRMGNTYWDYWKGSNGEWYYEGGKWSCVTEEHPKDLIEEAQPLWDALKKAGERWNAETMQVEEIPEFGRIRELMGVIERYLKYGEGEK